MPATLTADTRRREAFGAALAEAMQVQGFTQTVLGDILDQYQSSISAWKNGNTLPPDVETVFRIERVLKLEPGHLSRHLGFLPVGKPRLVVDAVRDDQDLDDASRRVLLATYKELAAAKRRHPTAHKPASVKAKRRVA